MDDRAKHLKSWKPGQSGNPAGKKKGTKHRSTIAREVLNLVIQGINPIDQLDGKMTIEEFMALAQAKKAIDEKDTAAYRALMDSAYGTPAQSIDHTTDGEKLNQVTIFKLPDDGRDTNQNQ